MNKNNLRMIRIVSHLTQDGLSSLTGIDRSTLSRIEHGWIRPTKKARKKLAEVLGVSEETLFSPIKEK